ncbi:protein of unknown function (plasmid) [Cupriavidus taiwanensis]|uniref:Uncharacterized protein n=2 Tax=Cupriavidus taiwanensis TaxID=164546 RepID=A0A375EGT7_9BURK|nr:protein of unknown function [Cupriavidus taiwanensis]SOZ72334.1 protein of unknown function [Cupriavidus taiwanensis]SOZ74629.1 protein of unknown function [Cupriavidus taiwanensis]SPA03541.1 protein of unknown function [Cupriavidus taiwanensis]
MILINRKKAVKFRLHCLKIDGAIDLYHHSSIRSAGMSSLAISALMRADLTFFLEWLPALKSCLGGTLQIFEFLSDI